MLMFRKRRSWPFSKLTISEKHMKDNDYNWLDDPFDEKKNRQLEQEAMNGSSRTAVGIGCIVGIVLLVAIAVTGFMLLQAISAS